MKKDRFAVFILTHKRPNNVITVETLKKRGYTGDIYFIVDDEDPTVDDYKANFGEDRVKVFSKVEVEKRFDLYDNFWKKSRATITYARNACYDIAREIGVKYFVQLDDDYTEFCYRFNQKLEYDFKLIQNLDKVFAAMLRFYIKTPAKCIALAQCGDFIGGKNGGLSKSIKAKRKSMNSFFCSTDREITFVSRMNEDVCTYVSLGSKGDIFFTINQVSLNQLATQSNEGGITELYLDAGTYVKSFYTVMCQP